MINKQKTTNNINQELENLELAIVGLQRSMDKCQPLLLKDDWSFSESESVDSFVVKFSRISDIFTQKILTSIVILSLEDFDGFIDKVNICEKLNVIISAEDINNIRALRNKANHEYNSDMLIEIFQNVMQYAPKLLENIEQTKQYIKKYQGQGF